MLMQNRLKNHGINPAKLTPPCLREQIQAMLHVFKTVVDKVIREKIAAVKAISEGGVPRSGGIMRQPRAPQAIMEAPLRKSPPKPTIILKGPAGAPLQQSPSTPAAPLAKREKKLSET